MTIINANWKEGTELVEITRKCCMCEEKLTFPVPVGTENFISWESLTCERCNKELGED